MSKVKAISAKEFNKLLVFETVDSTKHYEEGFYLCKDLEADRTYVLRKKAYWSFLGSYANLTLGTYTLIRLTRIATEEEARTKVIELGGFL